MKKLLFTLLLIALASQADAQFKRPSGANEGQGFARGKIKQKILERFDVDGDGVLNEEELAAAEKARKNRGSRQPGNFPGHQRMPENQGQPWQNSAPGQQMPEQKMQQLREKFNEVMAKLKKENPEKYGKFIQRYDANSDSDLDDMEIGNIQAERRFHKMALMRFDQNGDGKLDENEIAAREDHHQQEMMKISRHDPQHFAALLQRFDENKNGKIQFEEWAHAIGSGAVPPPMPPGGQMMGSPGQPGPQGPQGPQGFPGQHQRSGWSQRQPGFAGGPNGSMPPHPGQMPPGQNQPPQPPVEPANDGGLLDGVNIGNSEDGTDNAVQGGDFDFLDL